MGFWSKRTLKSKYFYKAETLEALKQGRIAILILFLNQKSEKVMSEKRSQNLIKEINRNSSLCRNIFEK